MNHNKINESGYNEASKFGPSDNNPPMYMFDKKYDLKGEEFIKPISSTYSIKNKIMKWKIRNPNVKPIPPEPNIGDTKVINKFAWLPIKHKSYRYWLQFYQEVYEWKTFDYWERVPDERIGIEGGWNQWAIEKYGVLKKFTKTDWKLIETRF